MGYTTERHTQIVIALLKFHGIKKVIASPGATNVCFIGSLQQDPYFEIYSSVDERSAAYMACGMAAESGEPVALTCTGSTASRNYIPGLTEAFYRHLPIVAITASQHLGRAGSLYPQFIDRSQPLADMVKESVHVSPVYSDEDIWACELNVNRALLALRTNGGGPVHINLVSTYNRDFSAQELPKVKGIKHIGYSDEFPSLSDYKRIAVLVGVHPKWKPELLAEVEEFCQKHDAVVLKYHAANYKGEYGVPFAVIKNSSNFNNPLADADLVIYFGSVARYSSSMKNAEVWRVSPDGKLVDSEKKLTKVFEMEEIDFFKYYNSKVEKKLDIVDTADGYARQWQALYDDLISRVKELPFSNTWIAQTLIDKLPEDCVLHLAGSNTARAWNFFELPNSITCYSNDGTMGIDGQVSALIGESLVTPNKLHYGVCGDLTFFYDMNCIGNRHVGNNVRLLIINNGVGAEFKIYSHPAHDFGDKSNDFMAAKGHFGQKSHDLIRHYATDLGYTYLSANNKDEFIENMKAFTNPEIDKPVIFEVFTDYEDESDAIYVMNHLPVQLSGAARGTAKEVLKKVAGDNGIKAVKKLLGKK